MTKRTTSGVKILHQDTPARLAGFSVYLEKFSQITSHFALAIVSAKERPSFLSLSIVWHCKELGRGSRIGPRFYQPACMTCTFTDQWRKGELLVSNRSSNLHWRFWRLLGQKSLLCPQVRGNAISWGVYLPSFMKSASASGKAQCKPLQ